MKKIQGYNLIEIMIVIAIIGILITIAFPNYQQYMQRSRRSDGISTLMMVMQLQERFFIENRRYTADLTDLDLVTNASGEINSDHDFYQIVASNCTDFELTQCVLLTATPIGVQIGDISLTLNSIGERTPQDLWD